MSYFLNIKTMDRFFKSNFSVQSHVGNANPIVETSLLQIEIIIKFAWQARQSLAASQSQAFLKSSSNAGREDVEELLALAQQQAKVNAYNILLYTIIFYNILWVHYRDNVGYDSLDSS